MIRHFAGRVGQAIVATSGVLTIVFFIMRLSGDPTLLLVPEGASAQQIAELRHALGFDRPLLVQYVAYLSDLAHLDLGQSVVQRASVAGIVAERIPYTMMLAAGALLVALGIGIPASLRTAVLRHVLRNASIPVVTIAALEVGNLLAGAVIVETVFAWPGIGQLAIQSIAARDFLVVQAIVLFVSTVYIGMNLLADIAYAVIDPRIRLER